MLSLICTRVSLSKGTAVNRHTTLIVAIALLVAGVLGMVATVTFSGPAAPLRQGMGAAGMDAMFIEQMIPHHEDAIVMAEIALRRAGHPEIRQLAEDVIRTQSAEVEQMREWYRQWFGTEVPERGDSFGMMGGMMGGMVDLEALEKADEFDKAFIEAMIPHHQMGIMMSRMAGSATRRPELRALTQSIVRTQSEEIDDMREWHEEWYGR